MEMNTNKTQSKSLHKLYRDACPRLGDAQFTPIVILTWFLLYYMIELQELISLGLDLLSSSFW